MQPTSSASSRGSIARQYLSAFYSGDFASARELVTDDVTFQGPFVSAAGKEAFFAAAARLAPVLRGAEVLRMWADGDEACAFFEMRLETPAGKGSLLSSEWYALRGDRVASVRLVFDTAAFRALMPAR